MKNNNYLIKLPSWQQGDKYGNVTLTGKSFSLKGERMVEFICKCTNIGWTRLNRLKTGNTKSCGCFSKQSARLLLTKHGLSRHPLYKVWCSMICRCADKSKKNYGGKGVQVCEDWKTFKPFYEWAIQNGYKEGLQLDKDKKAPNQTGKMYSPQFCSFLTKSENGKYRDFKKYIIEYKGESKPLYKWCIELRLDYSLLKKRIITGWDVVKAIETPVCEKNFISYKNQSKRLYEWCNIYEVNRMTISSRLKSGWSFEKAIETPIKSK